MKRFLFLLLVGWVGWQGPAHAQIVTENPKVGYVQSPQTTLRRIEITNEFTIAHCSFLTKNMVHCFSPTFIFIGTDTRLVDRKTGQAYRLVKAKDIPMIDPADTMNQAAPLVRHRPVYCNQRADYVLYFQKLKPGITEIDLVEPPLDGYESPFSFFKVQINNPDEEPKKVALKPEPTLAKNKPLPNPEKKSDQPKKPTLPTPAKPEPKVARPDSAKAVAAQPNTSFSSQPLNEGQTIRLQNLTFAQGKYDILASSYAELDHLVALMQENPRLEILLEGHTDNIGSPVENMKLSQDRVRAVKNYLTQKGIGAERIQTKAYGSTKPLVTSGTAQERTANRRVELKVLKK